MFNLTINYTSCDPSIFAVNHELGAEPQAYSRPRYMYVAINSISINV